MNTSNSSQLLLQAEQAGLRLAIKGRIVAVMLVTSFLAISRGWERAPEFLLGGLLFIALGLIHYRIIGTARDHAWVKYVFITIDVAVLSAAVAVLPAVPGLDIPDVIVFRFDIFKFYFIILAVAAFSFSPWLVMWTGAIGSLGWLAAFLHVISGMEETLTWSDIPNGVTPERFLEVFLDPNFVGTGTRVQEAVIFLVFAALIAIVTQRARQTVRMQLEAERNIASISQLFGRFVPKSIADVMIREEGALEPVSREATVLIADVANFTALTESKGAQAVVDVFNDYFEAASAVISANDGVVTQFIGDAVFATFNVPVEDSRHRQNGINAAQELVALARSTPFGGENLRIRVGVSTGPVVAGNVGGGGRATYTVYGEPVNLASRLEELNKELETEILISEKTVEGVANGALMEAGEFSLQGIKEPVRVYTLTSAE
ncbi:MAG: adenylate/guanylate cyclase domain-containing protein [Pseudomonadota bacterium]